MTTDDLVLLIGTKEIIIAQLRTELAQSKQELEQIKTRLANKDEGFIIHELMKIADMGNLDIDWSRNIHPYWLIASDDNKHEYYGCINLLYSKPIGGLEIMSLHPSLSKTQKMEVMYGLSNMGKAELKKHGCQFITMNIDVKRFPQFGRVIEVYMDATKCNEGADVYIGRT